MKTYRHRLRGDIAADWAADNPVLLLDEPGIEHDTLRMKIGDGITAWNDLPYLDEMWPGGGEVPTGVEKVFGADVGFNFNAGWTWDPPWSPPGLYREVDRVYLRGIIKKPAGTVGNARMIDLLPVGFRPGDADTWTDMGPAIYVDRTDNLFYTSTITVGDNGHLSLVGLGATGTGMKVPPTASECILTLTSISWQTNDPMPASLMGVAALGDAEEVRSLKGIDPEEALAPYYARRPGSR